MARKYPEHKPLNPDITGLSKSSADEIQPLWHCAYWDGPYDGMCLFNNEEVWFHCIAENECPDNIEDDEIDEWFNKRTWWRRYAIIRLTTKQLEDEKYWHRLFEKYVGTHTNYEHGWVRKRDGVHPDCSNHAKFYDEQSENRKDRDLRNNEVIGWFEL